jgi:hypothetical protein
MLSAGVAVWILIAWTNLYRFDVPWMDTWCYLSPAATGGAPFHLETPLLGTFAGADHTWGLHFPAAQLIYSVYFALLHFDPEWAVAMFILFWLALGVGVGWSVLRLTGSRLWAAVAIALVLADRSVFAVALGQRPEFIASLALLVAVMALAGLEPFRGGLRLIAAACAFAVLATAHPVTLLVGAGVCLAMALYLRSHPGRNWRLFACSAAGYIIGVAMLFLWFGLQPEAWSAFCDHSAGNWVPFSFGSAFWRSLKEFYYPTLTGHVMWALACLVATYSLWTKALKTELPLRAMTVCSLFLILCIIAQQKFYNGYYLSIGVPVVVMLVAVFGSETVACIEDSRLQLVVKIAVCTFVVLHGAFWFTRTLKYVASGCPDVRKELAQVVARLPNSRRILIPEVLWEVAIADPQRYSMNTLPYHASLQRRRAYESYAYGQLRTGDLVVIDRLQSNRPLNRLDGGGWALVGTYTHLLPGRTEWGYDLSVWRKL